MPITNATAQLIEYTVSSFAVIFFVMLLLENLANVIIDALGGRRNVD